MSQGSRCFSAFRLDQIRPAFFLQTSEYPNIILSTTIVVEHTISGVRARARSSQVAAAVRAAEPGYRAVSLLLFLYGPTRLRCPCRICQSSMKRKDKRKKLLLQKVALLISSSSRIVLCGVDAVCRSAAVYWNPVPVTAKVLCGLYGLTLKWVSPPHNVQVCNYSSQ